MDVVIERCAGLDVHKDTVVAAVRAPATGGGRSTEVRSFGTFTAELLALRDWLVERQVTLVAMESTGVYWKPVYYLLEDVVECWVVNARHMRNVPGRKTDVADAVWIVQLVEHGLVRPSFVPPPPIRELRSLTRYRKTQIEERTREVQRIDKVLQDAGLKLSSVASDLLTMSGRDMLDALVAGERDPDRLADLARRQMRRKIPQLKQALTGRFTEAHALVLGEILAHIDYLQGAIQRVSIRIDEVIGPFATERDLLITIPGVDRRLAEAIIAEIGVDMTVFETPGRLASWAGMCPGQYESAGKSKSGRARHGDTWLQRHLAIAAMAAARSKNTYLAAQYARLAKRRGKLRARKAVGHSILVACFHILAGGVPYAELGADYFEQRNSPERKARRHLNDLRALGWDVTETEQGVVCQPPQHTAA
jgi:transposase